jgi:alkaline phosphatase
VILGGGRREFRDNTTLDEDRNYGKRTDGLDLIKSWESEKKKLNVTSKYVWNRDQLLNLDPNSTEYTLGE